MGSNILDNQLSNELTVLCEFSKDQTWRLIYKATSDGFAAVDFHEKCDSAEQTLTIIKSTNGNVFGGYANVAWSSDQKPYQDNAAFIFSLVNKEKKPLKIKVTPGETNAIYCGKSLYGPSFGCSDLLIYTHSNTNENSFTEIGQSYKHGEFLLGTSRAKTILAGSSHFQTTEIEVYKKIVRIKVI